MKKLTLLATLLSLSAFAQPADLTDYVRVPGDVQLHKSCVHQVPDRGMVDPKTGEVFDASGKLVARHASCQHPAVRGRKLGGESSPDAGFVPGLASTSVENEFVTPQTIGGATYFNEIVSLWWVPDPPSWTIFNQPSNALWNGIQVVCQGDSSESVLQPVLEWGSWADATGQNWRAVSWLVTPSNTAYYTTALSVQAGEGLQGTVMIQDASHYTITTNVVARNVNVSMTVACTPTSAGTVNDAFLGVLESHGISRCQNFPFGVSSGQAQTQFQNTQLWQGGPNWNSFTNVRGGSTGLYGHYNGNINSFSPSCGFNVSQSTDYTTLTY